MKREKVRKPYWESTMFKWAENSRYNRPLTDKLYTLMLNRERLGIDSSVGNYLERWLQKHYAKMVIKLEDRFKTSTAYKQGGIINGN